MSYSNEFIYPQVDAAGWCICCYVFFILDLLI